LNAHATTLAEAPVLHRTVVLVGMMGAGKSTVGRRLATRLGVPFVDADVEIETAAGCSISEIFARYGETEFRAGERRVIARLLEGQPKVLATGGGAFMDADTRAAIKAHAVSIWLRADVEVLLRRVGKRGNRPLLVNGDPRDTLLRLLAVRDPVYAEADIAIQSNDGPHEAVVEAIVTELSRHGATA
jgi:shikimate kinase